MTKSKTPLFICHRREFDKEDCPRGGTTKIKNYFGQKIVCSDCGRKLSWKVKTGKIYFDGKRWIINKEQTYRFGIKPKLIKEAWQN